MTFRENNGQDELIFKRRRTGELEMVGDDPTSIRQRVRWTQNSYVLRAGIAFVLIVFALNLLFWPVAIAVRRHYHTKPNLNRQQRRLALLAKTISGLDLIFLISFGAFVAYGLSQPAIFTHHFDPLLRLIQVIACIGAVGTSVMLYNFYASWRTAAGIWTRLCTTGLALASVGYLWLILRFDLLQPSLSY